MKIKKITIRNFKGISEQVVSFKDGKITTLLGNNGKGKTSFIEALRYVLTGTVPQNPIKDGEESAYVSVETSDGTTFSRTLFADGKPSKVVVNGRTTPAKNLNAWLVEKFGFSIDVLKVATNADVLMSMRSDALGDFLLQYVPEKLNVAKVLGFVSDPTEDIQKAILLALPDGDFDIEEITTAHEAFLEIRKKTKKDLEQHKAECAKLPIAASTRTLPEIQKAFEDICNREVSIKAYAEAVRMYNSVVAERQAALDNISELQKRFDTITATRPNPLVRKDLEGKLRTANERKSEAQGTMRIMQNTVNVFNDTLSKLSTNHCPLSCNIVCTTDKTRAKADILAVIKDNEKGIESQQLKITAVDTEISSILSLLEEYDANEKLYNQRILLGEQILKIKKALPEPPAKPEPISMDGIDFEKEKSILREEMFGARKQEEREHLAKRIQEEERCMEVYEYLCKAFAPKGEIMTRVLSSYLSIFEEEINRKASLLRKGMEVKFVSENGIKFLIKIRNEKGFRLYDELSEGEKTLASFLLLDLVSSLCGTGIMIIDDLNHLDSNTLNEIFDALTASEFKSSYDHIIVASVSTQDILEVVSGHEADIQSI